MKVSERGGTKTAVSEKKGRKEGTTPSLEGGKFPFLWEMSDCGRL